MYTALVHREDIAVNKTLKRNKHKKTHSVSQVGFWIITLS
jgi:hypothetical protein